MATAHLLFGHVGTGKTTLARQLEARFAALRFTHDEWMARLFGDDPAADSFEAGAVAVSAVMEPIWTRCLALGLDVVLDSGFWRRAERDRVRRLVEAAGGQVRLYHVDCPEAEARARVARRNLQPGQGLRIASATFEVLRSRIEPLQPDEIVAEGWSGSCPGPAGA